MTTGKRLLIGASVILSVTAYWAYVGAAASWQYYLTVDECTASLSQWQDRPVRVSGNITPGSLQIDKDQLETSFQLDGTGDGLLVHYRGPIPDNLSEGRQVVVEGSIRHGRLLGDKLLTRCASKYSSTVPAKDAASSEPGSKR